MIFQAVKVRRNGCFVPHRISLGAHLKHELNGWLLSEYYNLATWYRGRRRHPARTMFRAAGTTKTTHHFGVH